MDLRCPNTPFPDDNGKECRARLQGPELESVLACLRAGVPYVDTRYCAHCKIVWRLRVDNEHSAPVYDLIPKGTELKVVADTDVFGMTGAIGRKLRKKALVT